MSKHATKTKGKKAKKLTLNDLKGVTAGSASPAPPAPHQSGPRIGCGLYC